jgi:hypothetical protein
MFEIGFEANIPGYIPFIDRNVSHAYPEEINIYDEMLEIKERLGV